MSETIQQKKGGPYTKPLQEQFLNKVYELYFEKGFTVVKIAEELDINRNTVSEYIKFWHIQIGTQFGVENLGNTLLKQLECLAIQRQRLLDDLEKNDDIEKKLRIEKLLFDIDQKITGFLLKMGEKNFSKNNFNITQEVSKEEIQNFTRKLVLHDLELYYQEGELIQKIILYKKCTVDYAHVFIESMKKLGLTYCNLDCEGFKMHEFTKMISCLSEEEQKIVDTKIQKLEAEE